MFKTRKGPGESQFCRQTVPSINPPNKRSANVRLTVPHEILGDERLIIAYVMHAIWPILSL